MNMDIVKQYVSNLLIPRLSQANLSEEQITVIADDISLRLQSLLGLWHNQEYINALFEIVKEEALFYLPKSHISIRCFVVLGIRNSCIEDAHSTAPFNPLLKTKDDHIVHSSKFIKDLTSEAIEFFKNNMKRSDHFSSLYQNTLFEKLDKKYPRAWKVLSSGKIIPSFIESSAEVPALFDIIKSQDFNNHQTTYIPVESGIDPNFDQGLLNQLRHVSENANNTVFFVPSFKHISRNLEKTLKVLEFLLYSNVSIVTGNYFFTSSKIFVRRPLLKPIHNNDEMISMLKNTFGVTKDHAKQLRNIVKNIL